LGLTRFMVQSVKHVRALGVRLKLLLASTYPDQHAVSDTWIRGHAPDLAGTAAAVKARPSVSGERTSRSSCLQQEASGDQAFETVGHCAVELWTAA